MRIQQTLSSIFSLIVTLGVIAALNVTVFESALESLLHNSAHATMVEHVTHHADHHAGHEHEHRPGDSEEEHSHGFECCEYLTISPRRGTHDVIYSTGGALAHSYFNTERLLAPFQTDTRLLSFRDPPDRHRLRKSLSYYLYPNAPPRV